MLIFDLLAVPIDHGKGPLRSPFGLPDMQNMSVPAPNRLPPSSQPALVRKMPSNLNCFCNLLYSAIGHNWELARSYNLLLSDAADTPQLVLKLNALIGKPDDLALPDHNNHEIPVSLELFADARASQLWH